MQPRDPFLAERIVARTEIEGDCWIWQGYILPNGYGQLHVRGEKAYAHRAMYEAFNGPIPPGLLVRHSCDVRACCNPKHLLLGTNLDNYNDAKERGRISEGDRHASKLTAAKVFEIRAEYEPGVWGKGIKALAKKYGVSRTMIQAILSDKVWKCV